MRVYTSEIVEALAERGLFAMTTGTGGGCTALLVTRTAADAATHGADASHILITDGNFGTDFGAYIGEGTEAFTAVTYAPNSEHSDPDHTPGYRADCPACNDGLVAYAGDWLVPLVDRVHYALDPHGCTRALVADIRANGL